MVSLGLASLEGFTRLVLVPASKDLKRFDSYDEAAARLVAQAGSRIALIGNSTTDRGVNHAAIQERLAALGAQEVHVDRFVADSSHVQDWYYILNEYFLRPDRSPDLIVITFYGSNLRDGGIEVGRLAQSFARLADWPELTADLPRLEDQAQFLVAKGSATVAYMDRIKMRILGAIVPGYVAFTNRMNDVAKAHSGGVGKGPAPPGGSAGDQLTGLCRLLSTLRRHHLAACFVAFPTLVPPSAMVAGGYPYALDPTEQRLIAAVGFPLLDLRKVEGLDPAMYEDELHLLEPGRLIYSRRLAEALAPFVPGAGMGRSVPPPAQSVGASGSSR